VSFRSPSLLFSTVAPLIATYGAACTLASIGNYLSTELVFCAGFADMPRAGHTIDCTSSASLSLATAIQHHDADHFDSTSVMVAEHHIDFL